VEHLLKDFFCRFYLSFRTVLIGTPRHETSQQNSEYRSGNFSIKIRRNDTLRFECLKFKQPIAVAAHSKTRQALRSLEHGDLEFKFCVIAWVYVRVLLIFCRV
jgi:hypothetical protein